MSDDDERYPLLPEALAKGGIVAGEGLPSGKREPRCGPWTARGDGSFVCEKCGEVDCPGNGPFGI